MPKRPPVPATVGALVRLGEQRFTQARVAFGHGVTNARDEAAYLTLYTLKLPLDQLPLAHKVTPLQAVNVLALFERRIRERKPAAYLTQEAWLGNQRFFVDQRVIVPRSYIAALLFDAQFPYLPATRDVRTALDLCTGSGCLAILLAKRYRQAQVDASDISQDALDVAQINVQKHRLAKRVKCLLSNNFLKLKARRYDLIVTNPPYVRSTVMRRLPREYKSEPALALAAGRDGLDAVRIILEQAAHHLNPGGTLMVECGHARALVERTWPWLPFVWAETSGGDDCVFILTSEDLVKNSEPLHRFAAKT